jgi:hypothetical protein
MINHNVLLENKGLKNVVLGLQMTLIGSSCKAGTTNFTVHSTTLTVGGLHL